MAKTRPAPESRNKNQRLRLILAFVFWTILMLIIAIVLFNVSKQNVLSIGHLNSMQIAQSLQYYLIEETDEITLASKTVEVMQDTGKSDQDILEYLTFESRIVSETIDENYTGMYGYINGVYMDGSGWVPPKDYEPTERPWYTGAAAGSGKVIYITPYLDSETGTFMLSICKLLQDGKSVISLDVSLDRIQDIIEMDQFTDYDQIIVADKENIVVAALDGSLLGTDMTDSPLIREYRATSAEMNSNGHFEYRSDTGASYAVFASGVEDQWNVFLIKKNSEMMRSLYYIYAILAFGSLSFIGFISFVIDYLNKRRKVAETLNIQLESIADIYISVHKIDIQQNRYEEVRCMPYVREQIRIAANESKNCFDILAHVMKALVRDEYWENLREFIDPDTLDIRVGNSNTVTHEFLGIHGWVKARIIVLERKNDRISSILWLIEDISEEKRKQGELRHLSETDLMTGIRNRVCGERLVKEALRNESYGMFCLMDADHFKSVNDNYGHSAGDEVIRAIAGCMKASFRANDILFRLGGDEFAAYIVGINNESQSEAIMQRFLTAIEKIEIPAFIGKRKIELSIGASFVNAENVKSFAALYKEADRAVYRSKKTPGSCITYYDPSIDAETDS